MANMRACTLITIQDNNTLVGINRFFVWQECYGVKGIYSMTHYTYPSSCFSLKFSLHRVGVALKEQPAVTRTCLGQIIVNSYKKNASSFPVEIEHLYNLANIRDLLVGHTFPIPHITKPQAFRFSTDPTDGKIKMQVQHRSYENQWARIDA